MGTMGSYGSKIGSPIRTKTEYAKKATRKDKECAPKSPALREHKQVPFEQTFQPIIACEGESRIGSVNRRHWK
jgi:hypothetical protein